MRERGRIDVQATKGDIKNENRTWKDHGFM